MTAPGAACSDLGGQALCGTVSPRGRLGSRLGSLEVAARARGRRRPAQPHRIPQGLRGLGLKGWEGAPPPGEVGSARAVGECGGPRESRPIEGA